MSKLRVRLWQGPSEGRRIEEAHIEIQEEGKSEWLKVDLDVVERGIEKLLEKGFAVNSSIRGDVALASIEDDGGYLDVLCADCIIQAGLFGEVIYG